ncbi:hypothetical protein ACHMWN_08735 [Pedobacter sp. UC225_61]|uniref:hypothetical protein n=1 Tax=Pedobacter sp. UC225_61 TaxID=3374623 RepID=UPI0037938AD3
MVRIESGIDGLLLTQIADKHWDIINPRHQQHVYFLLEESLIGRIENKRNDHLANGNIRAEFYDMLLADNYANLKKLILCSAAEIREIIAEITLFLADRGLLDQPGWTTFSTEIFTVFGYENWRSNGKGQRLYELLNLEICPYCNLETIQVDYDNDIVVASFDHYYLKAKYPYLSMTFSNLIPVCQKCNQTYKLDLSFCLGTHIHPYQDDYDSYCYMECDIINDVGDFEVNLFLYNDDDQRVKRFNHELSFTVRYNHSAVLKSVKSLVTLIQKHYGIDSRLSMVNDYNLSMQEITRNICEDINVPYTKTEILNHQYGKVRRDIAIQSGLIQRDNI